MAGRRSQRKGRSGEIELTNTLQAYSIPAAVGDPVNHGTTPDVTGLPGVHVECKRVERLDLYAAMAQSRRDSAKFQDGLPAVFHRRNRSGWLVTMDLENWIKLYKGAIKNEK